MKRSIKYWSRFFITFLNRFKRTLAVSVVLASLFSLFYLQAQGLFSFFNRGEVIGLVGKLSLENLPPTIQNQLSSGLTIIDNENQVKPGLAVSWVAEENGKVWIFKLGDYLWQDNKKVVASDINYRFTDVHTETIDSKTIKFTLLEPYAPFPTAVTRPIFKQGLIGVGDWKITGLSSLSAEFTKSVQLVNRKTRTKKTYRFYNTEEEGRIAFKLGHVSKLEEISDLKDLTKWPNIEISENSYEDKYAGLFMNTLDPVLSEKNIRQALAYAINKENFPKTRAYSTISPNSWAFNPQVKQYQYNPVRAKELLDTLSPEAKKSLNTITLITPPSMLDVADKIKKNWADIGIQTNIQIANSAPTEFQALLAVQAIPPDPDQYGLWHSTQNTTNVTKYGHGTPKPKESPRIDKLLEDGRRKLDEEERRKIYFDFQRYLLEDLPVIPLYYPSVFNITKK